MKLNRSILSIAVVSLFVACSQQGEGERCVIANGDADCDSGLVCTNAADLEAEYKSAFPTDRCCPSDTKTSRDPRCETKDESEDTTTPTTGTAGAAGATGGAAEGGGGGMSSAGAAGDSAGTAGTMSETAGSAGAGT